MLPRTDTAALVRNRLDCRTVAAALGIKIDHGGMTRCVSPDHADRDPSMKIWRDGFKCFGCDKHGSAIDLIALVQHLPFKEALKVAADMAGVAIEEDEPNHRLPRPSPLPPKPEDQPPKRPPTEELEELWNACQPVTNDPEVSSWLKERGLPFDLVADLQLARALPPTTDLPGWAAYKGSSWSRLEYRLIFPMYDCRGRFVTVRARRILPPQEGFPKSLPPTGYQVRGALFACELGRTVLEGGAVPDWWSGPLRVIVTEGEVDFLVWATRFGCDCAMECAPLTLGIVSGSWTSEIADRLVGNRVPADTRVIIRTDHDDQGNHYFEQIARTLQERCVMFRSRPAEQEDS